MAYDEQRGTASILPAGYLGKLQKTISEVNELKVEDLDFVANILTSASNTAARRSYKDSHTCQGPR